MPPKVGKGYVLDMPILQFLDEITFRLGREDRSLENIYAIVDEKTADIINQEYPFEKYGDYYYQNEPNWPNLTHPIIWEYVNKKHDFGHNLVLYLPSAKFMNSNPDSPEPYTTDRFEYPRMMSALDILGAIDTYFDQFRDADPTLSLLGPNVMFIGLLPYYGPNVYGKPIGFELNLEA